MSSAQKDTPDANRRWPDSSLGKGYAVPATSSGAVLWRASDRRDGSGRCGPGADPPGVVGSRLERIGRRSGAEVPRPLRHHGLVLSRRSKRSRSRRALERAAGHARPALLLQRAAQAGMDGSGARRTESNSARPEFTLLLSTRDLDESAGYRQTRINSLLSHALIRLRKSVLRSMMKIAEPKVRIHSSPAVRC